MTGFLFLEGFFQEYPEGHPGFYKARGRRGFHFFVMKAYMKCSLNDGKANMAQMPNVSHPMMGVPIKADFRTMYS